MTEVQDDTIDIQPRSVEEVTLRVSVLVALVRRAALEVSDERDDDKEPFMRETDRFDLYSWLRREAGDALTEAERDLLETAAGDLDDEEIDECLLASAPARALAWSLGVLESLDLTDGPETHVDRLLEWAPQPWDEVGKRACGFTLRDEEVLAIERERWELWHWRATVGPDDLSPGGTFESAVSEVAEEAAAAGLIVAVGGDFSVAGQTFTSLDMEEQEAVTTLAEQYLAALNWVCGFGDRWADVPLYPE